MSIYTSTANGATALKGTGSALVDLFFNIGAARKNPSGISQNFDAACLADIDTAAAILLWARDIRHGGAGERNVFRHLLKSLIESDPDTAKKVIDKIPDCGRFDDLQVAYGTPLESHALKVWTTALKNKNALAFKWADRKDKKLREALGLKNEAELRKFISLGRKDTLVEQTMCDKKWGDIKYDKLPSVAGIRYAKAFKRNDEIRYSAFIGDKTTTVNTAVNFPHDVYRAYAYGDAADAASKYWKSLLETLKVSGNILVMPDVSGSMGCACSGKITCMDVAVSLGAFLAQSIQGNFHNKLVTFSQAPTLVELPDSENLGEVFNFVKSMEWGGNTNFEAAYKAILKDAVYNNVPKDQMPTHLLVLSDMQFDPVYQTGYSGSLFGRNTVNRNGKVTVHKSMKEEFAAHGYELPKVIYWNLNAAYGNVPTIKHENGVALVSGFSPQVLKSVLAASEFTPEKIMAEAIAPFKKMLAE